MHPIKFIWDQPFLPVWPFPSVLYPWASSGSRDSSPHAALWFQLGGQQLVSMGMLSVWSCTAAWFLNEHAISFSTCNRVRTIYTWSTLKCMHLGKLISWTDLLETLIPGLCHVNGLDTMCWTIYLSSIRSPICLHICRPIHAIFIFIDLHNYIFLFWHNYLSKYLITLYI